MPPITPLRLLRLAKGIAARDLAETVGVHVQHLLRVERSQSRVSVGLARRLARALDVQVVDLFLVEVPRELESETPGGRRYGVPDDSGSARGAA